MICFVNKRILKTDLNKMFLLGIRCYRLVKQLKIATLRLFHYILPGKEKNVWRDTKILS